MGRIRKTSDILKIDGVPLLSPTSYSVSMEDLELNSARTADGILHRDYARKGMRKVSLSYEVLTQQEMEELLPLVQKDSFQLTYQDPQYGVHTITCYCAAQGGQLSNAVLYQGLYHSVTLDCIQL